MTLPLYPGNHWIGGWVDPRADLDDVEKRQFFNLPGVELRPLGHSASSQSLYQLCYPGYVLMKIMYRNKSLNWTIPYTLHWSQNIDLSKMPVGVISSRRVSKIRVQIRIDRHMS
jgi:hypothetical protein